MRLVLRRGEEDFGIRGMNKLLPFFLVLLSFVLFVSTYNLVTLVIRYHNSDGETKLVDAPALYRRLDPIVSMPNELKKLERPRRLFHVAVTATDEAYIKWQCRIMYYWYKRVKDLEGSEMGGFTRVLHSGSPDNLMNEIPTFVVNPLPDGMDRMPILQYSVDRMSLGVACPLGYIVLNRPWAFVQWLDKAKIEEDYILMAEPDHIFVRPLPNLSHGNIPAAFPFFYINPIENEKIIRKFYTENKGPVTDIDPIGNSPVIIKKSLLEQIAPTWMNVSLKMKEDPETDNAFGWVLEMYAYAVASALHGVVHILHKDFMIQPPWDLKVGNAFIIHYTYGCDFSLKGELIYGKIGEWRFDKRSYLDGPPPRNLSLPPPGVSESVVTLVKRVNEATANIAGWEEGK